MRPALPGTAQRNRAQARENPMLPDSGSANSMRFSRVQNLGDRFAVGISVPMFKIRKRRLRDVSQIGFTVSGRRLCRPGRCGRASHHSCPLAHRLSCGAGLWGFFVVFFYLLAAPGSMWDLSSPTRAPTRAPCVGSRVLAAGPPGES